MTIELITPQNIKNQVFVNTAAHIRELISPLSKYGITHFSYQKKYPDGSVELLCAHPEFTQRYIEEELYKHTFNGDIENYVSCYALWDKVGANDISRLALEGFDIANGFVIIKKSSDFVEFYHFATSSKEQFMDDFYLNNIDIFEAFILYFDEHAVNLLETSKKHRMIYPTWGDNTLLTSESWKTRTVISETKQENICEHPFLESDKLLSLLCKLYRFTFREHECACYLKHGLTPKQISKFSSISIRTAEKHVLHLKRKLNCKNINMLLLKLCGQKIINF